jgi:Fe-S cluster assembly protein SufD
MPQAVKEKDNYFAAYKLFAQSRAEQDPAWLANLREKAGARFEELDFPTTRDEEWKYTNVAPLLKVAYQAPRAQDGHKVTLGNITPFTFAEARRSMLVFINGQFSPTFSNVKDVPDGVVVSNFPAIAKEHAKVVSDHLATYADYRDAAFTALNTAHISDGAVVYIPSGKVVTAPIQLLFVTTTSQPMAAHPRVLIVAGEGSVATVIESYFALGEDVYLTNAVTEVVAQAGATLTHYRLQEESEQAFHIATTQVHQERSSNYSSYAIALGGKLTRHELNVALTDENSETTIDGLYIGSNRQHIDNHTTIDHQQPHCQSHQLYKGILDGQARAVFSGKVIVREGALLTDARQLNKNLLLSLGAHIDTKPQLEIFADDVKCSHGATVGQLEEEELFYLATRGIAPERARALLTYGFAEDVISKIKLKSVRTQLDRMVLNKLHQSLEVE